MADVKTLSELWEALSLSPEAQPTNLALIAFTIDAFMLFFLVHSSLRLLSLLTDRRASMITRFLRLSMWISIVVMTYVCFVQFVMPTARITAALNLQKERS